MKTGIPVAQVQFLALKSLLLKMRWSVFVAKAEKLHSVQLFSVCMCQFITSGCLHSVAENLLCNKAAAFSLVDKLRTKTKITVTFQQLSLFYAKSWKHCLHYKLFLVSQLLDLWRIADSLGIFSKKDFHCSLLQDYKPNLEHEVIYQNQEA